ncbi:MAG TPA: lipase [Thermoguttaceae bacterium]|nr:lipase [Thermoguttaceae bacterium]
MASRAVTAWLLAWSIFTGSSAARGEESPSGEPSTGHNELIAMPTMGGKQFWADEYYFRGWRIQCNVVTGHYRLLDPSNQRHTWGTFDECRAKLDEIRRRDNLAPMKGRAVVVLHGLMRSRKSMARLCAYLEEKGGFTVVNVSYPTTRRSIGEHAKSLARLIDSLEGIEEINFVGHSMGNIVVRHYLGDRIDPATGRPRDGRFRRMVMLAPPNHGSRLAAALADNGAFVLIDGRAGQELGADWDKIKDRLAVPPFAFGVIAGGRGDDKGFNPLLPGDDDGTISVATTHLPGEADFLLVPVLHSFIMNDPRVMESTLRFIQTGRFDEPDATTEP